MAMGGGFEVYFQQNRNASFRTLDIDAMARLAHFCRIRQPFCWQGSPVPQIGLWYSLEGWKEQSNQAGRLYGWQSSKMEWLTGLFLDCQYSADVLMDHTVSKRMDQYPIVVIPEWDAFNPEIESQLLKYAENGGNILIIGARTAKKFKGILNVSFANSDTTTELLIGDKNIGGIIGLKTDWQPVLPNADSKVIGHVYNQNDYRYATKYPVATINNYGKGKIAVVYMDISTVYQKYKSPVLNQLFKQIIQCLVPNGTLLHVVGSDKVHVALTKKEGDIFVHLINSSGEHANPNIYAYNELRPTPSLLVSLKLDYRPKTVVLEPTGEKLDFRYQNNCIEILVPPVKVYSIIKITSK